MKCFVYVVSLGLLVLATEALSYKADWWNHAVFYQIYPRSFKDSNNDGKGDLKGIIDKLDHIRDAGVTAAWISPIYPSPQVDAGYDISNFTDIDPTYGTLDDFEKLVTKAKKLGLKIVMDFVPNHSSDQHIWFKWSENRVQGYEDYYIWRDAAPDGGPPNNWLSVFKYSAWEWSEKRKQYYLHQFAKQQPDLNFRNPQVVQEMKDVMTFWMDRGVDGFRVDAIPHMFEDEEFKDEPKSERPGVKPWEYDYLDHIYTKDVEDTFDMVYQYRQLLDDYSYKHGGDTRILMTEAYSPLENIAKYYGDGQRLGAHFSFNFILITDLNKDSTAQDFADKIERWFEVIPEAYTSNWVLGNHDQHRVATRYGTANVDGLNMLMAVLPGVGVTYNGEEIGMENGEVSYAEGQDPSACNAPIEDFDKLSRDFERTPFHWDNTVNAGFNEGARPWLPVSSKYETNNLKAQSEKGVKSHFHVYQELMKLRKSDVLASGDFSIKALSKYVIGIYRKIQNKPGYIYIFNKDSKEATVDAVRVFGTLASKIKVLVASSASSRHAEQMISATKITLEGGEAFVAVEV